MSESGYQPPFQHYAGQPNPQWWVALLPVIVPVGIVLAWLWSPFILFAAAGVPVVRWARDRWAR